MTTRETPETLARESRQVTQGAITVLSIGWKVSFALIVLGLIIAVIRDEPLANELGSMRHVLEDLTTGHSNGFLGIGILAMILSPIIATATIAAGFFRIGDRRYGLVSTAVFTILVASIAIASL